MLLYVVKLGVLEHLPFPTSQSIALPLETSVFPSLMPPRQVYSDSEQVTLNVGGHKFTTTIYTLRMSSSPSLFNAMFSGRHTPMPDEIRPLVVSSCFRCILKRLF